MSRIGRQPVKILQGVTVSLEGNIIKVKGPKGESSLEVNPLIKVEVSDSEVKFTRVNEEKKTKQLHGLYRSMLNSMVAGVTEGYKKDLEIKGIGYRAEMRGADLVMQLGYSHPITMNFPAGVSVSVNDMIVTVSGIDKQLVGRVAAKIRAQKVVEVYKGKGIRYVGEQVRRKAGKSGKA